MTADYDSSPPRKQVSRLGLYLPTILMLLLAAGWSGFWWYSSKLADREIDSFIQKEASEGRAWSCSDRSLGGYPFRLELRCGSVGLKAEQSGRPVEVSIGSLTVVAQIYNPRLVLADVQAPLALTIDGESASAQWDAMRISLRLSSGDVQRLSVSVAAPRIAHKKAAGFDLATKADSAEIHLRPDLAQDQKAIDIAVLATGASIPELDRLADNATPANIEFSGIVVGVADAQPGSWKQAVEAWRRQNGRFEIKTAKVTKGAMQVEADGALDLDDDRRIRGKLNASATGAGPLLAKLGVSSGSNLQQALGGLLGKRADAIVGAAASLKWPVRFENGRVSIGPVRTPLQLSPLY